MVPAKYPSFKHRLYNVYEAAELLAAVLVGIVRWHLYMHPCGFGNYGGLYFRQRGVEVNIVYLSCPFVIHLCTFYLPGIVYIVGIG